jgi:hypothetical protein
LQPYQPQYPQQAHQQRPYGAPLGTQSMPQQQYTGQPPQVGGQMPPTAAPKLGESGKGGGGAQAPAPRHLIGRTVIIEPVRIDESTVDDDGKPRPTAHYHLTVVDGGPLQYGDNKSHNISEQHGMTFEIQTPCRFTNVQSDRFGIVNEVRDTLARGELASVGVIQQGTKGNKPFLMTKCSRDLDGNERPDGAQRFEAATQVWNAVFAKTFASPEPRSLVAPPAQQPPQVAYQPTAPAGAVQQQPVAAYPPQGYPMPQGQAAAYVAQIPAPQQPTYVQAVAEQAAPGFQTPYAAANPGTGPYGDGYHPPQPQSAPPAAQPQVQQMPQPAPVTVAPNPAFEAWLATLPPEQQAQQRAALAGQAAAQPQQPDQSAYHAGGPGF